MQANQRIVDENGYEVMLFPMEYMNISQGEGGNFSHNLAMDFLGWDSNGRVEDCPYYAPCSCECVFSFGTGNNRTWQSLNPVHIVKNNTITKVTFCFNHDENPPAVGTILTQGDLIGHSGTAGEVTGDHMHFNTALGEYDGYILIPGSSLYYELKHSSHIYETCFVNGTTIIDGEFYIWTTYHGQPSPTESPTKKKFPWYIYANKLREKNTNV